MGLIDFNALLYDPIHTVFGEEAQLTLAGEEAAVTVSALDKTDGIAVGDANHPEVETIKPVAMLRMAELAEKGIEASELDGAEMVLNGKTWRIEAHRPVPSPKGEADGEMMLFLSGES